MISSNQKYIQMFAIVWSYCGKCFSCVSFIASQIEETSRKNGYFGNCLNMFLMKTVADKFPQPFKIVIFSPIVDILVVLAIYIVFCILFFPLWITSYVLTSWGSIILLIVVIVLFARSFARTMTFPGSTMQLSRELSFEYLRRLSMFFENVAMSTGDYCTLILSARIKKLDKKFMATKYADLQPIVMTLHNYLAWIKVSLQYYTSLQSDITSSSLRNQNVCLSYKNSLYCSCCKVSAVLKPEELESINQFVNVFEKFMVCFDDFNILAVSFCTKLNNQSIHPVSHGTNTLDTLYTTDRDEKESLIYATTQFLQQSEEFKNASVQLKPKKSTGGVDMVEGSQDQENQLGVASHDNIFVSAYNTLQQLNTGPTGLSLLSMPIMRAQLYEMYNAEEINLKGADGQLMDSIFIPASKSFQNPVGTVLFLLPNAGIYECLAQMIGSSSCWLTFYYTMGFNLCYYNYRGYGRSAGVPTPSRIKRDAEQVILFLKTEKNINSKLIVHGESLGGMTAASLAKNNKAIDLLVCDRTFASLDAVANRMLGWWAGYGLRYIGMWETNVCRDYILAGCKKVILQDPNDEIIANASSLRSGVATYYCLKDSLWSIKQLPRSHQIAIAKLSLQSKYVEKFPPSSISSCYSCGDPVNVHLYVANLRKCIKQNEKSNGNKMALDHGFLNEDFISALYTCLSVINLRYKSLNTIRKQIKQHRSNTHSSNKRNIATYMAKMNQDIVSPSIGSSNSNSDSSSPLYSVNSRSENSSNNVHRFSNSKQNSQNNYVGIDGSLNKSDYNNHLAIDSDDDTDNGDENSNSGMKLQQIVNGCKDLEMLNSSGKKSVKINGSNDMSSIMRILTNEENRWKVFEKVWVSIASLNLNIGQLLGSAFNQGYDVFRAWLCTAIVFNGRCFDEHSDTHAAKQDSSMSDSITSSSKSKTCQTDYLLLCSQECKNLVACSNRDSSLSLDSRDEDSLLFLADAFQLIHELLTLCVCNFDSMEITLKTVMMSSKSSYSETYIATNPLLNETSTGTTGANNITTSSYYHNPDLKASMYVESPSQSSDGNKKTMSSSSSNQRISVGKTITFHTGHGGWPSEAELQALKAEIKHADFNISI